MHTRRTLNRDNKNQIGGAILGITTKEKDSGVTFSADTKVSYQCGITASKGNRIIGIHS